jgi:hypothetical protein
VRVPPESVCLPDCEARTANPFAITIENAPGDLDDLSLRNAINSFDGSQVIFLHRRASYWKIGTQNLVRGPLSVSALPLSVRRVIVGGGHHEAPQFSGEKPEA